VLAVITTGFHRNEVRAIVGDRSVKTDSVITNMSLETRPKLDTFAGKLARFAFVCRDPESIPFYTDMLNAELDIRSEVAYYTLREKAKLETLLRSTDVLLTSPSVYVARQQAAPKGLPVINVLDRVDPMSLRVAKGRLLNAG